ncbi:ABC transporter ATP-binding protein [Microbacterium sp. gxy059]|uniref:ABC transporter ATP-binding protein n=1 Tax=Microbacterium sp. gxy059 TaxID=2957199 RepID=UPI003D97F958
MTSDALIRFDRVSKVYPGAARPAVAELSMDIPDGALVSLVGPSGCGKTTTMKMVNRLVDPSSGTISLGGSDIGGLDQVALRRRIGYVIQQVGLLPHRTIADNVATVPKLLGWSRADIRSRVGELLDLVGVPESEFGSRYPSQLSGGQAQRVGVARALAANPDVMLMDEPFGAIDPITRIELQDELLRIQREMRKTILFVTHDIDEAVKMSDRIAVFDRSATLAQFAEPDEVLRRPATDFVERFVGSGAAMQRLRLRAVGDLALAGAPVSDDAPQVPRDATLHAALDALVRSSADALVVTDAAGERIGAVSFDDIRRALAEADAA